MHLQLAVQPYRLNVLVPITACCSEFPQSVESLHFLLDLDGVVLKNTLSDHSLPVKCSTLKHRRRLQPTLSSKAMAIKVALLVIAALIAVAAAYPRATVASEFDCNEDTSYEVTVKGILIRMNICTHRKCAPHISPLLCYLFYCHA